MRKIFLEKPFFDLDVNDGNIVVFKKLLRLKNIKLYKLIMDGIFDGTFSIEQFTSAFSDIERRHSRSFNTPDVKDSFDRVSILSLNRLFGNLFPPDYILHRNHSQLRYLMQKELEELGITYPEDDMVLMSQHSQVYGTQYFKLEYEYRTIRIEVEKLQKASDKNMKRISELNTEMKSIRNKMELILIFTDKKGVLYNDFTK